MNNKGFTLVELLSVVIILTLLISFVMPQITSSINDYSEKTDKLTTKLVLDSAKLYIEDNIDKYPKKSINNYCITLNELIENEYLKDKIKLNDKDITNTKSVRVIYNNNKFNYELVNSNECINYKEICEPVTSSTVTTGNIPQGNFEPGDEYICEVAPGEKHHFLVLGEEDNKINLIMNHNILEKTIWISKEDYIEAGGPDLSNDGSSCQYDNIFCSGTEYGPITAIKTINTLTGGWYNLENLNESYRGTILFNGKARMPYIEELFEVGFSEYWNPSPSWINNGEGYWLIGDERTFVMTDKLDNTVIVSSGLPLDEPSFGLRVVIEVTKDNITKPICTLINDTDSSGSITSGDKYKCEVKPGVKYNFYVLSQKDNTTSLIMDRNINSDGTPVTKAISKLNSENGVYNLVEWLNEDDHIEAGGNQEEWETHEAYKFGPLTAMNFLQEATKTWTNTKKLTINSFINSSGIKFSMKTYKINARLPRYNEMSDSNGTNEYLYGYLDYSDWYGSGTQPTNNIDGIEGYWSDSHNSVDGSYMIYSFGIFINMVETTKSSGVRPVIELDNKYIQN